MNRIKVGAPLASRAAWIGLVLLVGLLLSACEFFASEWGAQEETPSAQEETPSAQEETPGGEPVPCVTGIELTAIGNQVELEAIQDDLGGNYCLTQDIPLRGNWVPLATFTGSLDGRGNTISGLTINEGSIDTVGFFKELGANAIVKDLSFSQPNVTGRDNVGVLAGISSATAVMTNLQITGSGTIASGSTNIGGLVGDNAGDIKNSYATGALSGTNHIGGLVGLNTGTIENSYAMIANGVTNVVVSGGFVGKNEGRIKNSYATGTASGDYAAGGFVGVNTGAIENSYATGTASGGGVVGGLVGENGSSGIISNSYFATGAANGIGRDDNSQTVSSLDETSAVKDDFVDWDFTAIWTFTVGKWPTLAWQNP